MGKTKIEYCDEVSNPLYARLKGDETSKIGTFCEKPDKDGSCSRCWAETLNLRFGNKLTFDKANRDKIEWKFRHQELNRIARLNAKKPMSEKFAGLPTVVFCFDTFDIFQPSITDEMRDIVFNFYDELTNLILLVQTTYPAKMNHYFKDRYGVDGLPSQYWIGMSAGTQKFYDDNIRYLRLTKASQKYVIFEPLLESIKINTARFLYDANISKTPQFTFIIVGGESGTNARPFQWSWAGDLKTVCEITNTAFFMKQGGAYQDKHYKDFNLFPKHLQVRQFPRSTTTR